MELWKLCRFDRSYLIPFGLIDWVKENVFAVRVDDTGGNGGMYGGPHAIGDVQLADVASVSSNHKSVQFINANTNLADTLRLTLKVPVDSIEDTLKTKVYNPMNDEIVYEKRDDFIVGKNADSSYPFAVQLQTPGAYKIDYSFTSKALAGAINHTSLFSYTSRPRQQEHREYPVVKIWCRMNLCHLIWRILVLAVN